MPARKRKRYNKYESDEESFDDTQDMTPPEEDDDDDDDNFHSSQESEEDTAVKPQTRASKRRRITKQEITSSQDENDGSEKKAGSKEKRLARFRSKMPSSVRTRLDRALEQRLYLIERKQKPDNNSEVFVVLGSTGNVYNVEIGHVPSCTCPDFVKGELCKHILYVYLRVLRVPKNSYLIYQKALLTNEVQDIFSKAPFANSVYADESVRKAYAVMQGTATTTTAPDATNKQKPLDGEPCPVCYEDFTHGKEHVLFCAQCGTNIHDDCWKTWKERSATCVYCRAPNMGRAEQKTVRTKKNAEGYVNLGKLQHDTPAYRDTSTYNDFDPSSYRYGRRRRWY